MTADVLRITWIGHATVLIEIDGVRILTDPALTSSLAHLRRRRPAPAIDELAPDLVLVSHLHMDHLHRPSLRLLTARSASAATPTTAVAIPATRMTSTLRGSTKSAPRIVVPTGSASLALGLHFSQVDEMQAGDHRRIEVDGRHIEVEAVHADHSGSRGPHSRVKAAAIGFVVRAGTRSVYFAGDTDLFADMAAIGPVEVALVPVWGWGPSLGERHLNPSTAADAAVLLDADHVIAIHWGTYSPVRIRRGSPAWLDDPLPAFREALGRLAPARHLIELHPGDSVTVPPR